MSNAPEPAPPDEQPAYKTGVADGNLVQPVDLSDFLQGLGVVLRLPGKTVRPPRAVIINEGTRPVPRTRKWAWGILATIAIVVGAWQVPWPAPAVPDVLVGTWATPDARYAGRELEFTSHGVRIQAGGAPDDTLFHRVTDVRVARVDADLTRYAIVYEDQGAAATLEVVVRNGETPRLSLLNQGAIVWHRGS